MTPERANCALKRLERATARLSKLRRFACALIQGDAWLQVVGDWKESLYDDPQAITAVHDAIITEIAKTETIIARAERRIRRWK